MKTFLTAFMFLFTMLSCTEANQELIDQKDLSKEAIDTILLDINRVFFSPVGRLRNVPLNDAIGEVVNQNKFYDYTTDWENKTDALVWGIDINTPGELRVIPFIGLPDIQKGSQIEISIGEKKKNITLNSTGGYNDYRNQDVAIFDITEKGRYQLCMKIKSKSSDGNIACVKGLKLTGKASINSSAVKLRWRPAAVHASFNHTSNPQNIIMAVYEHTIITNQIACYQPITTPFGYFGSTWDPINQQFGGLNFSLWTFSANSPIPPTEQFSHLIAVGEDLYIDGFNHEGTGVKARGNNPYEKMVGSTQILAVKKIPGNPYDVYYSYYYDTANKKWKLYGCGKKYNASALKYLTTGAFVEQPGSAEKERSNHKKRQVKISGWLMTADNQWLSINTMIPTGNLEEYSYKNWKSNTDGSFIMEMGGFESLLNEKPENITSNSNLQKPDYLNDVALTELSKLPASIEMKEAFNIGSTSATVSFNIVDIGTNPIVKIYWGKTDGLTFVEGNKGAAESVKWDYNTTLAVTTNGLLNYTLNNLEPKTTYYYRLQIKNDQGETWTFDTQKLQTK